jgi:Predicted signal transduction protein with a C-terminal ATPase domain
MLNPMGRSPEIISDGHSVGLRNVNARLALYFGKGSRLSLSGAPGMGACVRFEIPYRQQN